MSYTGQHGTVIGGVAHEAAATHSTVMDATRDITRRDQLGRNVVIVPKGQPIPVGLDVNPDDVTAAPATSTRSAPDPAQLHRPEPDIGGQQRFSTRIERLMWLGTRR